MSFQVSINHTYGSLTLDVSPSTTIEQIKQMVNEQDSSIDTTNLVFDGKPLDDKKTLSDYSIVDNATLRAERSEEKDSTVVTPQPPKKKKNRCSFKSCNSAPLRGVGDCGFCEGRFCSKHRLLEQHDCVGLHNCKQQMHERNAVKLQSEQTQANKV